MPFRILYLTINNPCGEVYGGQLRALNVGRALSRLGRVTLVIARDGNIAANDIDAARAEFDDVKTLHLSVLPKKGYLEKAKRNLNFGIRHAFNLSCGSEEQEHFLNWESESDLIWFFGLRVPSALGVDIKTRTFIDIDDIRSQVVRSEALNETKMINRFKLKIQTRIWRFRESRMLNKFAGFGVCSEADRDYLGSLPSIHVIPNGFQRPDRAPQRNPVSPARIGFIGTLDYPPNADGLSWFITQVWQRIKEQCPSIRLRLVGSGTNKGLARLGTDIDGLGYLADTTAEIASWSMMVVPVFVGGGTRVKISEGFSKKCPIVSTSLGAYGYDVRDGTELFIADAAQPFAAACLKLIQRPQEAVEMAERAWKIFLDKWTWDAINPRIWAAAEDCLRRRPAL